MQIRLCLVALCFLALTSCAKKASSTNDQLISYPLAGQWLTYCIDFSGSFSKNYMAFSGQNITVATLDYGTDATCTTYTLRDNNGNVATTLSPSYTITLPLTITTGAPTGYFEVTYYPIAGGSNLHQLYYGVTPDSMFLGNVTTTDYHHRWAGWLTDVVNSYFVSDHTTGLPFIRATGLP